MGENDLGVHLLGRASFSTEPMPYRNSHIEGLPGMRDEVYGRALHAILESGRYAVLAIDRHGFQLLRCAESALNISHGAPDAVVWLQPRPTSAIFTFNPVMKSNIRS